MAWTVEYTAAAARQLRKLDHMWQGKILDYMTSVAELTNPRSEGKALHGDFSGVWRYRLGDYRILAVFDEDKLIITATKVGHRREVYR